VAGGAGEAGTRSGPRTATPLAPLYVADNAPPADKPVTLIYGGGFNPAHEGHATALQDSYDQLTKAGYKVARIIVAPTSDKLLADKVDPIDHLRIEGRASVARAQMPKEINGVPVEMSTEPAAEGEAMTRKPRRIDLSDWAQRQNPDHTIINVAGEDASAPGSPNYKGPKLYQGAPGTAHEGVNYIEQPRDVRGISATRIRNAHGFGEPIPNMSPEAADVYRDEWEKQKNPPPPPPPPRGPAPVPSFLSKCQSKHTVDRFNPQPARIRYLISKILRRPVLVCSVQNGLLMGNDLPYPAGEYKR
jgi:hypothetical protein